MERYLEAMKAIIVAIGAAFDPSTHINHPRMEAAGVSIRPIDSRGRFIFSRKGVAEIAGKLVKAIFQNGRDPVELEQANLHLIESETLSAAVLQLTDTTQVVRLPDGSMGVDRVKRIVGGGSTFKLAGMVLWIIFQGVGRAFMPTRYTDGQSGDGTNNMLTIFGLISRAGAGPQFADFLVIMESGRWIIVSVKGMWENAWTIAQADDKDGRWKAGEAKPADTAGATRVTTNGAIAVPYFMERGGEVLHLNVKVDADTGLVKIQSARLGAIIRHQGGCPVTQGRGEKAAIYLSKEGGIMRFSPSRLNILSHTNPDLVSQWIPLTNGEGGMWTPMWSECLITPCQSGDVPANFGVTPSSKRYIHTDECGGKCRGVKGAGCNGGRLTTGKDAE